MKPWPFPTLVAHRGGGTLAPENTLAAIRLGQSLGYRAAEFDVKLSRDGVAFLLHDATLDRTTSGHGPAGGRDWADLAGLDAGGWHSSPFRGEPLARFDEAARTLLAGGTLANIEIKPSPGRERETGLKVAAAAASLWEGHPAPLLSSFSLDALLAAREAAPELPRGWLVKAPVDADFEHLDRLEAASLHFSHRHASPELVDRIHAGGRRAMVWTVNEIGRAEVLLGWGVDGIFTDNLQAFAKHFPTLI